MALPEGYKRIEYVESNGTGSYFNTGILPTSNTRVVFDGYVVSGDTALYGSRYATNNNRYAVQYISSDQYRLSYDTTESLAPASYTKGTRYVFDQRNNKLYIDDVLTASVEAAPTYPNAREIYAVGAINTNNSATNFGVVRMYSMQIYQEDSLVRDFLPVQDATDTFGLYDNVSQKFFTNAGSGSITGGEILKYITGIMITTPPAKTEYRQGEELDLTGMVVSAVYSDDTEKVVSDYTVSGFDPETVGAQTVIVTYQNFTAEMPVRVNVIPTFTVTFVDWSGQTIVERVVKEGNGAEAPADPTREGYLFTGWDKEFSSVTMDMTVTAQYAKAYTVHFYAFTGDEIKKVIVPEGGTAPPPTSSEITDLEILDVSWDQELTNISADLDVYAIYTFKVGSPDRDAVTAVFKPYLEVWTMGNLPNVIDISGIGAIAFENYFLNSPFMENHRDKVQALVIRVGITELCPDMFAGCANLMMAFITNSIQKIGERAFYNCVSLSACGFYTGNFDELSENAITQAASSEIGISIIGDEAFKNCSSLNSPMIPNSITHIGAGAFSGCDNLDMVYIGFSMSWDEDQVYLIGYEGPIYIGKDAFSDSSSTTSVTIWKKNAEFDERPFGSNLSEMIGWKGSSSENYATKYGHTFVPMFKVTFIDWDGTVLQEYPVESGNRAFYIKQDPERNGYSFTGWDKNFYKVTEDMIVTAQYEGTSFTVTFVDWDGVIISTQLVESGQPAVAPEAGTREGYTFTGWDKDFSAVTENLTITALYSKITYIVTFVDWSGSVIAARTVDYKTAAQPPDAPKREGYFFLGWDSDFSSVTDNITVTALYDFMAVVTLNPSSLQMIRGDTGKLEFILGPEELKDKNVIWSNSSPSVAGFNMNTLQLTAWTPGSTIITVTHTVQKVSASCAVTVLDYSGASDDYKQAIKNNNRGIWDACVLLDGNLIPREDIVSLRINEIEFQESKLGVGSVVSSYAEITFRNRGLKFLNKNLTFKLGMTVGNKVEYVPFGNFYVTDSEGGEEDETVEVTAYDSVKKTEAVYQSALTYPTTMDKVVEEAVALCGLKLNDAVDIPATQIAHAPKAKTCKEVLAMIAQLIGCNVVADRDSKIDFRLFNMTDTIIDASSRYYSYKRKDMDSWVRSIKIVTGTENFMATNSYSGDEERNALDISFSNLFATESTAQYVLDRLSLVYRPGELEFLGDPSICVGDIITVQDKYGNVFRYPIMENIIEYDGGVKNRTKAYSESEEEQEITAESSSTDDKIQEIEQALSSGLKCISCTELPANPDPNTIYLIQGEVTVS